MNLNQKNMRRSSPWNNKLDIKTPDIVEDLHPIKQDKKKKLVLGSRLPLRNKIATIMIGTDVSGKIHLGHVALLCIADMVSETLKSKITVSINELESVLSRDHSPSLVIKDQSMIIETLKRSNYNVHSRLNDPMLILFSTYLWNYLLVNSKKHNLFSYYERKLPPQDILSIAIMATTPLMLSLKEKTEDVLAIYGVDEFAHLELIYQLYNSAWFKKEVLSLFGVKPPRINYLLIKTMPDKTGIYKMSKSRPTTTIFIDEITKKNRIKEPHICDYLEKLSLLIKSSKVNTDKNVWYNTIKQIQDKNPSG